MATRQRKPAQTPPPEDKPKGNLVKIGALWLGNGKKGKFMSGRIQLDENNEMRVLVFKNGYKEQPKHPDYIIYEPTDEETQPARGSGPITDDDIPF